MIKAKIKITKKCKSIVGYHTPDYVLFHNYYVFKNGTIVLRNGTIKASWTQHSRNGAHYERSNFRINGKKLNLYIHRVVAEAFLGNIPNGYHVNHKDKNTLNNHVDNLEIIPASENYNHRDNYRRMK